MHESFYQIIEEYLLAKFTSMRTDNSTDGEYLIRVVALSKCGFANGYSIPIFLHYYSARALRLEGYAAVTLVVIVLILVYLKRRY